MKTKITFLFLSVCAFINAQSISSITVSNGGEYLSNGSNSINVTIGEAVIGSITNSESVHQGFWASTFSAETLDNSSFVAITNDLAIFPNPVTDILSLKSSTIKDFKYTIFNTEGKKIIKASIANGKLINTINLRALPSGLYLLQIEDQTSSFKKSIKFLKH